MSQRIRRPLVLLLALLLAISLTACVKESAPGTSESGSASAATEQVTTETAGDVEPYKIGVILPMTGGSARMGELQLEGFKLFADYYNEKGGIASLGGAKIELVNADSAGNAETGASEAERLITAVGVDALVGPYNSAVGSAIVPIAEKNGVPLCLTNCTADGVLVSDTTLKYSFRPNHSNSSNVGVLVDFVAFANERTDDAGDMKSFALVYENTDWGKSCLDTYAAALQTAGYTMAICEPFESGSADFSTIVNKIKSSDVDFILPAMYVSDSVLFLQQINEYQVKATLIWAGGGVLVDDFISSVGADTADLMVTLNGWCQDSMADSVDYDLCLELNEKCLADTGTNINENVANGWIGIATLIDAVERAGTKDKDAVAEALAATDLDRTSIALLFHPYQGIKFGSVKTWNGSATMQNQNIYASGIMTQIIDETHRQVFPDWSANPFVWPVN